MGRNHTRLPDHLYISPPPPRPSSAFASASSFFSPKSGLSYTSAAFLLLDTSTTRAFERCIPGFKTSAAFLTALRANLDPQIDDFDTPVSTPDCLRPLNPTFPALQVPSCSPLARAMSHPTAYSDADLAPPAAFDLPRSVAAGGVEGDREEETELVQDPNAIPELVTIPADSDKLRIEALRLVADSVAQQRQRASRALIFHPATFGILAVALGLLVKFLKGDTGGWSDYAIPGTSFFGILMTVLISIRAIAGGYIDEAERVGTWKWLNQGRAADMEKETGKKVLGDRDDDVLLTKFGNEYIGTIIFRGVQALEQGSQPSRKTSRKSNSGHAAKTEIRAWTVRQRYRGKGVGTALLEDAIKAAYEKGWTTDGIEIANDHANSKVVLPKFFSGFVQANDAKARRFVDQKVVEFEEMSTSGKGKRRR